MTNNNDEKSEYQGDKYEYKIVAHQVNKERYDSEEALNKLGQDGWQLAAAVNDRTGQNILIFVRVIIILLVIFVGIVFGIAIAI